MLVEIKNTSETLANFEKIYKLTRELQNAVLDLPRVLELTVTDKEPSSEDDGSEG